MTFHLPIKSVLAGIIGNVMEWYDFALYGFMATIIARLFFPSDNEMASLIATYGIFAAGFIMRPIGAVFFGRLGDKIGRSRTMLISVIMMVIPTFGLGLLPTYEKIGLLAPILLIIIRLVQGVSVGGEFSSSATFLVETAPKNKRGQSGSWANFGSTLGVLLGSGMATLTLTLLDDTVVMAYAWRLPFLFGGLLGCLAIYLRIGLPKSKHFQNHLQNKPKESPLKAAFTTGLKEMIQGVIFAASYGVIYYSTMVYLPTWVSNQTAITLKQAMLFNTMTSIVVVPLILFAGWISDRYIRRTHFVALSMGFCTILGIPAALWMSSGSIAAAFTCQLIFGILMAISLGVAPTLFVELFPTSHRLTGYSISFNLGMGIVGGTTPMIVTWLIATTGISIAPALYMLLWGIIAVITLFWMHDYSREPLR
jgi:MHS family proline/betaine transporter-like MFS transporter